MVLLVASIVGTTSGTRSWSTRARCPGSRVRVSGSWMAKSVEVPETRSRESTKICRIVFT
jgi:hypothetical protein